MSLKDLSCEEITCGINKVAENAKELILDGDTLLNKQRIPRAYTLFQLAIEEINVGFCFRYC